MSDESAASQSTPRVLATFLEAVCIDSPSGEEAAFGAWCADRLRALGCSVRVDETGPLCGSDSGNLIAEFPGSADGTVIVLSAHLDTVEPGRGIVPVVEGGVVRSAGETVLGADDKAGIAAILEALARVREGGLATPPVRILLTTGEERGLQGAKVLAREDCSGDLCVVLDAHGEVGGIVGGAPTQYTFAAEFHGTPAHAGVEPEKGRSALVMAAKAVAAMRVGRLDESTTANVGYISGGGPTNVITASCVIRGECRSIDPGTAAAVRDEMDAAMRAAAGAGGGSVDITWRLEYEGFRFPADHPAMKLLFDACADVGLVPDVFDTGGGSDANILHAKGLPSLVLSCGMTDVHSTSESITVADLIAMSDLVVALLRRAVSA